MGGGGGGTKICLTGDGVEEGPLFNWRIKWREQKNEKILSRNACYC